MLRNEVYTVPKNRLRVNTSNWDLVVSSKINHTSDIGQVDLNTVTTDGTYTVQPTANSPVSSVCFLEVYNTGSYDLKQVLQRLDDVGNLYIRHRKYTSTSPYYLWSSWYKFTGTIVN